MKIIIYSSNGIDAFKNVKLISVKSNCSLVIRYTNDYEFELISYFKVEVLPD